jgi:hypothetical protein
MSDGRMHLVRGEDGESKQIVENVPDKFEDDDDDHDDFVRK